MSEKNTTKEAEPSEQKGWVQGQGTARPAVSQSDEPALLSPSTSPGQALTGEHG